MAFTATLSNGYKIGRLFDVAYLAHRVIWLLVHKKWPKEQIDHINGDKADNRLSNLRSVSRSTNGKNQKLRADNLSGVMGVSWYAAGNKWQAYIAVKGKRTHLGHFDDLNEAIAVRRAAEPALGYHPNHGRR